MTAQMSLRRNRRAAATRGSPRRSARKYSRHSGDSEEANEDSDEEAVAGRGSATDISGDDIKPRGVRELRAARGRQGAFAEPPLWYIAAVRRGERGETMVSFSGNKAVRLALGAGFGIVAVALVFALRAHAVALTLAWSVLILLSFVGWGSIANLWLTKGRRVDWGLRAGWGMAFVMLVGGYLTLVHAARRPVLIAQVVIGVAAWLWFAAMGRLPRISTRRVGTWIAHTG